MDSRKLRETQGNSGKPGETQGASGFLGFPQVALGFTRVHRGIRNFGDVRGGGIQ